MYPYMKVVRIVIVSWPDPKDLDLYTTGSEPQAIAYPVKVIRESSRGHYKKK